MAKPPTTVRSIRLPNETWDALASEADRLKLSVNALIGRGVQHVLSHWSPEEIASMKAKAPPPLVINRIEPLKPPPVPYGSRLKKR